MLRLGDRPGVQVEVEGADRHQRSVNVQPRLPARERDQAFLPLGEDLFGQAKVLLFRVDLLDGLPEHLGQQVRELALGGVVQAGRAPGDVVDQQVADGGVVQLVAVDGFFDGQLAAGHCGPQGARGRGRELPHVVENGPGQRAG